MALRWTPPSGTTARLTGKTVVRLQHSGLRNVSVQDGALQIKNVVLDPPEGVYNLAAGAVASKSKDALYGYYETRMKASGVSMSSTFWFKTPFDEPIFMHLATETYNWEIPPTLEELAVPGKYVTYYDWICSYELVQ